MHLHIETKGGIFPECLKMDIINPIYKKGLKRDTINLRLIVLTSVIGKILKNDICKRMYNFYTENYINCVEHGLLIESFEQYSSRGIPKLILTLYKSDRIQ